MVYSQEFLNTTLDNINDVISVANHAPDHTSDSGPTVQVLFKGSGLHSVGGPTPFVEISTSVENNNIGLPESTTTRITLTGKIVRPQAASPTGSGISHVISGIKSLSGLFDPTEIGEFKIQCSSTDIYSLTGVKVVSVDITKTSDNWVQTADYTVVLENNRSLVSGYSVKNIVDTWSIESLEDYVYTFFNIDNINLKQEYHNPKMKPNAPSVGNLQPSGPQSGGPSGGISPNVSSSLDVISIPQFKVSHTVGAVGVPSGTGNISGLSNTAYFNAVAWVMARIGDSSASSAPSGIISTNNGSTPATHLATGYFYNHLRSTNANISEGRFEVVDTWLAMPTGIGYIEDYTIDLSTDDRYIHTVSVKGEVRGLSLAPQSGEMQLVTGTPTKLAGPYGTGYSGSLSHQVPDVLSSASNASNITYNKYLNASSGWINDIKPYLYRRACVAMSTADRTVGYVPPLGQDNSASAPNNPVYSKHGLLNVIPIGTQESYNTRKGIISYDYTFNNKFTYISGVISESISFEDTGPTDVISEAFVLGRALGPVLQNLGTKTTARKSASIEVTVVPPSSMAGFFMQNSDCPLWTGGTVYTTISGIIEGLKPFGDRPSTMFGNSTVTRGGGSTNATGQVYTASNTQSWDPTNGRFTKSVTWIYQQCTTDKNWLDH